MAPFSAGTARTGAAAARRRHPAGPSTDAAGDPARDAVGPVRAPAAARSRRPAAGRRPRRWVLATAVLAVVVLVVCVLVARRQSTASAAKSTAGASSAASTVATDVNALATDLAGEEDARRACPLLVTAAGLACTEAADMRMGTELGSFARAVSGVRMPAAQAAGAARLRRDASALADDLRALGSAPTADRYLALAAARDVQPLGRTVDADARALVTALRR